MENQSSSTSDEINPATPAIVRVRKSRLQFQVSSPSDKLISPCVKMLSKNSLITGCSWTLDYLSKTKANIAFIGSKNSGKSTLLNSIKDIPVNDKSIGIEFSAENELSLGPVRFKAFDSLCNNSDSDEARRVWKSYFPALDAIVFIVDAADKERINESREELAGLLQDEQVSAAPVLVLGNKIDKPNALSEDQLKYCLCIQNLCTGKGQVSRTELTSRPMEVFMCSVLRRQGYGEGFRWLSQYLD